MFKSTDKKLEEIGFKKVKEDKWAVVYERYNDIYKYMQVLTIRQMETILFNPMIRIRLISILRVIFVLG